MTVQWLGPKWLRFACDAAPLEFFSRVTEVSLRHKQTSDGELASLHALGRLESLTVQCSTQVSDPAIDRFQQKFPDVAVVRPGDELAYCR